jgi:hypothetical protein
MKDRNVSKREPRRDRMLRERVHDSYKTRLKLPEPTVCPQCKAVFGQGRWQWTEAPAGANEELCQACHRINDAYPAGELTLRGEYLTAHKVEIMNLARNQEDLENGEHPLNRIMEMTDSGDTVLITTTDIHLPRRIGEAVHKAFKGEFDFKYDDEGYFIRADWRRDV